MKHATFVTNVAQLGLEPRCGMSNVLVFACTFLKTHIMVVSAVCSPCAHASTRWQQPPDSSRAETLKSLNLGCIYVIRPLSQFMVMRTASGPLETWFGSMIPLRWLHKNRGRLCCNEYRDFSVLSGLTLPHLPDNIYGGSATKACIM